MAASSSLAASASPWRYLLRTSMNFEGKIVSAAVANLFSGIEAAVSGTSWDLARGEAFARVTSNAGLADLKRRILEDQEC